MIDDPSHQDVLHRVSQTLAERRNAEPGTSYVASLYHKGLDAILKKVAEESAETLMAAKDGDRLHLVWEVTDLWFHSLILMNHFGLGIDDILQEFRRREGISGIDEKRARVAAATESITRGD
ncbi:MAG: phosphoribosyl-ATP diphosphatase [Betaproteobacteria bacterium]|nr:phosphoribosyl-ATP diphosphatase [Betaproteobacteria bacterium]